MKPRFVEVHCAAAALMFGAAWGAAEEVVPEIKPLFWPALIVVSFVIACYELSFVDSDVPRASKGEPKP